MTESTSQPLSPRQLYQQALEKDGFVADDAQRRAVEHLEALWQALVLFKDKRNRFLGRSWRSPQAPRGLYFWGGVGRGKSFLMDIFFQSLPYKRKKRVHFHAFMSEIHQRMRALHHEENPLNSVAAQIAQEVRVLCFDEFHVSDIADAMILGRLLEGLLSHGVVMVTTSNYAPEDLYFQGQNRSSFLPTIDLIQQHLDVLNVDSGEDYRLRTLVPADVFFHPAHADNEKRLATLFQRLSLNSQALEPEIKILGRILHCKGRSSDVIWFDFYELCFTARSQEDYLQIAKQYHYVLISGIHAMDDTQHAAARRFTWLIDVLYDYRVKLAATFNQDLDKLYPRGDFANEFSRTISRLQEMQSEDYLHLPHLALDSAHQE